MFIKKKYKKCKNCGCNLVFRRRGKSRNYNYYHQEKVEDIFIYYVRTTCDTHKCDKPELEKE